MDVKIYPIEQIEGIIQLPTSKSQTLRALFSALFVKGISIIYDALDADDSEVMINCLRQFGLKINKKNDLLCIHSPGFYKLKAPLSCYIGSSGIALRFLAAFSAYFNTKVTFHGSSQLHAQRSMLEIQKGLSSLGVKVRSSAGFCPFSVQGPIKNRQCLIRGLDSQPISALLWVLGSLNKKCILKVLKPHELPWINLTLTWLKKQNKKIYHQDFNLFHIRGKKRIKPFIYRVPKDFSSAAFMIALGLLAGKKLTLPGLEFKDPQGDKQLIYVLKQAGAQILRSGDYLEIFSTKSLNLHTVNMASMIDAVPIMAALGVISQHKMRLIGALGARGKESDRLACMKKNLESLGGKVFEQEDGLMWDQTELIGGTCEGFKDHRIAMATAILATKTLQPIFLKGADCVSKTYPLFFEDLKSLGVKIEVID